MVRTNDWISVRSTERTSVAASVANPNMAAKTASATARSTPNVEWKDGRMQEIPGSEFEMKADLVLLAMGFLGPVQPGLLTQFAALGVEQDARSNIKADTEGSCRKDAVTQRQRR